MLRTPKMRQALAAAARRLVHTNTHNSKAARKRIWLLDTKNARTAAAAGGRRTKSGRGGGGGGRISNVGRRDFLHSSASRSQAASAYASAAASFLSPSSVGASSGALSTPTSSAQVPVLAPTRSQLRGLFVASAVPMVGFGFMDNFIMIQAGGYIDATIGARLGLATLTAAAVGQVFSDLSGVLFGGAMERSLVRMNLLRPTDLTVRQRTLPLCRNVRMAGAALGVVTGCLLGASVLIFRDLEGQHNGGVDGRRIQLELDRALGAMLQGEDGESLIDAERCLVYLVDEERKELWTEGTAKDETEGEVAVTRRVAMEGSPVGRCANTDRVVVERDVECGLTTDGRVLVAESVLCAPVRSSDGKVVAVVEFVNKRLTGKMHGQEVDRYNMRGFTDVDAKLAMMLANHIGRVLPEK